MNITREGISQITDEQICTAGYDIFINHGTYFIAVTPMTFGKGRIIYAEDDSFVVNGWCYEMYIEAIIAMHHWDLCGGVEPVGWIRNPFDGRRRPGGDPEKEFVQE